MVRCRPGATDFVLKNSPERNISIGDREIGCKDGKMIKYDRDCVKCGGYGTGCNETCGFCYQTATQYSI